MERGRKKKIYVSYMSCAEHKLINDSFKRSAVFLEFWLFVSLFVYFLGSDMSTCTVLGRGINSYWTLWSGNRRHFGWLLTKKKKCDQILDYYNTHLLLLSVQLPGLVVEHHLCQPSHWSRMCIHSLSISLSLYLYLSYTSAQKRVMILLLTFKKKSV